MKRNLFSLLSVALGVFTSGASDFDYSDGILIVNEDWYGHQNSSINFLDPENPYDENWKYRIIREENPGMELGCTNQFAAIWNGRLYCIAKQEKDPGASVTGGRITVCDASSMKILHQQALIDNKGSQCDGRAFVGIDEHKGYISSSNGIWIFDLDSYEIKGKIEGSDNPYAGGDNDKPNTDPTGALYYGQTGVMIYSHGKVFATHQQYGLLIIDAFNDRIEDVLSMDVVETGAGIGSIVSSKDGNIWISVAKNTLGLGNSLNYLVKLDPATLEYEVIALPEGISGPLNSWYAWTPDAFVSSSLQNCLYWKGGTNIWFSGVLIFKFDIDKNEFSLFLDLKEDPDNWKLYGCSMGVDPLTDEIYMSLFHEFGKPEYLVRRYSNEGEKIKDYPMIENYWFPSIILFPQKRDEASVKSIGSEPEERIRVYDRNLSYFNCKGKRIDIFSLDGKLIDSITPSTDNGVYGLNIKSGMYILKCLNHSEKIVIAGR